MPPLRRGTVGRELCVEADKYCTWQVASEVVAVAVWPIEVPTHVKQTHRCASFDKRVECLSGYQIAHRAPPAAHPGCALVLVTDGATLVNRDAEAERAHEDAGNEDECFVLGNPECNCQQGNAAEKQHERDDESSGHRQFKTGSAGV